MNEKLKIIRRTMKYNFIGFNHITKGAHITILLNIHISIVVWYNQMGIRS
jgi:hypothetical protein